MHFDDQAFLERLIGRLRELESLESHEQNRTILDEARAQLLDAIAETTLRIAERDRERRIAGTPPPADPRGTDPA